MRRKGNLKPNFFYSIFPIQVLLGIEKSFRKRVKAGLFT